MTTYFVSGYMRTGTSMMMRSLEAGGLEAVYNPNREELNEHYGDEHYKPNEGGLYELSVAQYRQAGFPRMYEGMLVKLLHGGLTRLVAGDYRVVFMRRDPEEIRQSYIGFFGRPPRMGNERYVQAMDDTLSALSVRRDVAVTVLWYRDVVEQPLEAFERLERSGWPIDPERAAPAVDPAQCRYRLENLEVGIV